MNMLHAWAMIFSVALFGSAYMYAAHDVETKAKAEKDSELVLWKAPSKDELRKLGLNGVQIRLSKFEAIVKYYTSGTYEKEVAAICEQAEKYIESVPEDPKNVAVFDYHDTITYLHNGAKDYFPPHARSGTPIKPVVGLFQAIRKRNIPIVILCAASPLTQEKIDRYVADCKAAGCGDYLDFIFTQNKLEERQKLVAKGHKIVCCVGDRPSDFEGGNTGYQVKLPNHIY